MRRFRINGLAAENIFWQLWNALALVLIIMLPTQLRYSQPVYRFFFEREKLMAGAVMGAAYLLFALFLQLQGPRRVRLLPTVAASVVCFGAGSLFLFGAGSLFFLTLTGRPSGFVLLLSAILGTAVAIIPIILRPYRVVALLALIVACVATIFFGAKSPKTTEHEKMLGTALNSIEVTYCHGLVDPVKSDGGGIAEYGDGFLLMTGSGELYKLEWRTGPYPLKSTRLPTSPPMDRSSFLADQPQHLKNLRLRITDLALDASTVPAKIYVAHQIWNREEKTFGIRVSMTTVPVDSQPVLSATTVWTTIFDSQPGLAVTKAFDDSETGGRLALTTDGKLLLSLGDHGFDGRNGDPPLAQSATFDYGKVLMLDLKGGHDHFTIGHRNPQGLAVDRKGRVWETEHGPQGGDELNLLTQGNNYGWPFQTYGTDYGHTYWPLLAPADAGRYQGPAHAFVPSIAISNLIELGPEMFPEWDGDLLVASLRMQSLYRVRLNVDQVAYVEPIHIGHRIRDLEQGKDGRIVLWNDAGVLIVLSRIIRENVGERLYQRCVQCHESAGGAMALAPSLRRTLGRPIASERNYGYSPAMTKLGGSWTAERLDEFLRNPEEFAPGTSMKFEGLTDASERKALLKFLMEYR